jgi:hypothetical protein
MWSYAGSCLPEVHPPPCHAHDRYGVDDFYGLAERLLREWQQTRTLRILAAGSTDPVMG